jgi:hypothetical protein
MTTKTDFTPDAWKAILDAPAAIAQLVVTASLGLGDLMQEMKALSGQLQALVREPGDLPLLQALGADIKAQMESHEVTSSPSSTQQKEDPAVAKARSMATLTAAVTALDATATPEEAAQVKQWLYGIGDAVSKAAKEGDMFGFGGTQVSDAETAVLAEIKSALGI